MEHVLLGVMLDANVLVPIALCDTLLRAAVERLYRPLWSMAILDEMERNLVRRIGTNPEGAQRRRRAMLNAFPEALVTGYEELIPRMRNDEKDRHVLAAAVHANAQVIVTENRRDFPPHALVPYPIEVLSADTFLQQLFDLAPGVIARVLNEQAADLRQPHPVSRLLDNLAITAPVFVMAVRAQFSFVDEATDDDQR